MGRGIASCQVYHLCPEDFLLVSLRKECAECHDGVPFLKQMSPTGVANCRRYVGVFPD
jgi:hypothetical protein